MKMCQECKSLRIAEVNGKTSDMACVMILNKQHDGYVPRDMNIGGGDYLSFAYCLDCGQMEGVWPIGETELEAS